MISQKQTCPLCHFIGKPFYSEEFCRCLECQGIFRCPEYFLSPDEEKSRYKKHNNDVQDIKYQEFVAPIVNNIVNNHAPEEIGLDFGAGTGPVISHVLGQKGYQIQLYDPFFHYTPEVLDQKYDFIIACEVIEHFHNPKKEFKLLFNLLKPGGKLYLMTDMYNGEIDFGEWYYKNDPTHVFFYSKETFAWIQKHWNWKNHSLESERCIIFEK